MNATLLDRLHREILESERLWKAAEISEAYLKISAPASMASSLIRRVLSSDPRFLEVSNGSWTAVASPSLRLSEAGYLSVWVDTRAGHTPDTWVLWMNSRKHSTCRAISIRTGDPESWEAARRTFHGLRPATIQAGAFGRFQQWMCRCHAVSEWDPEHLDVGEWTRIALATEGVPPRDTLAAARLPEIRERWNLGPSAEDDPVGILRNIGELLDILLDRHGSWTEQDLHREWETLLAGRAVDTGGFDFSLDVIAELPEKCGIYRFYDATDTLLYVGKTTNIARRVRSYFRPYPPEHSRREDLMKGVRRFEYDLLPSEIEALIKETRVIRTERPAWNVQVDVHPEEQVPPDWWWPLAYAARGDDPDAASIFLLTCPESGFLFHMPPGAGGDSPETWSEWLDALLAVGAAGEQVRRGSAKSPAGVETLDVPESRLALRYYLRRRDVLDRIEPGHASDGVSFLRSLEQLVKDSPGFTSPILPRPDLPFGF